MNQRSHIREAGSDDIRRLTCLVRNAFRDVAKRFGLTPENCPKHPSNCTEQWIENDIGRGVTYYILNCHGVAAGCVALEPIDSELGYLERLGVLSEERRKGFGRKLVDHLLFQATLMGLKQIRIGIIASDTELKRWYLETGFVEGDTKKFEHLP